MVGGAGVLVGCARIASTVGETVAVGVVTAVVSVGETTSVGSGSCVGVVVNVTVGDTGGVTVNNIIACSIDGHSLNESTGCRARAMRSGRTAPATMSSANPVAMSSLLIV